MVQLLLEPGADPNYRADEPVGAIYTAKPGSQMFFNGRDSNRQ